MAPQTRHSAQDPLKQKLKFHERLLKSSATDALLKKLKSLHTELASLDQEVVDVSSLGTVRKELINTSILLHKDRGVKAYAACCLADILRLYAPDAPYTQSELRDIFQFFFRQLSTGLKGTDSAYYNEYFHLLESLSTVKSVVLVCDLPTAEELMVEIFRDFFSIIKRDLAKKIEMFMVDILVALIDECQVLPTEVLETILSQFMDKNTRPEQSGHRLAVQVCNATADKLQRHVCQHFTDVIVSNSNQEDFSDIRVAHELIKRLHHSCPGLLHSVIPQLEEELRVEEVTLRSIATQTLGEMFADKGGSDLVRKYPATWNIWILRRNDRSAAIRLAFVEVARGLLINLPEQKEVIEESLIAKIVDPDEKVRAAACKLYGQLDYETALHHVSEQQLRMVADRALDKKHTVRVEALTSLGKLYSLAYPEIENNDPLAIKQFSWIPNSIFQLIGINSEVRSAVEEIVMEYILPLASSISSTLKVTDVDEVAWTDRLLQTMKYLEDKSINAVLTLTGLKHIILTYIGNTYIRSQGGIIDEDEDAVVQKLNRLIQHIAGTFSDPHKVTEDLHEFAKLNENRLYKLMKICMDPQTDLKGLIKATTDFNKRMEQLSVTIAPTMAAFLRRSSFRIVNQSSVPTLIKHIQRGDSSAISQSNTKAAHAQTLLHFVSKHYAALYKPHIGELIKAIASERNETLVEIGLNALASVLKWDDKLAPTDRKTLERITRLALQSNKRHAKFAARVLAISTNGEEACMNIVEAIVEGFSEEMSDPQMTVARISALAEFAKFAPNAFEHKSDVIMAFLLKQVLMVPTPPDQVEMETEEEWVLEEDVSPILRAKILALKVCRNRSFAHASSEKALEISTPVFKMFATLLEHNGSFSASFSESEDPKVKSRMRLQAAVSLLHLSTVESYATAIAPKFMKLAVVIQDSCYNVRMTFLTKLLSLLQLRQLPPRYNIIPFLTVHDPETDVKSTAASYISGTFKKMNISLRTEHFELIFIRLLHLLAHHPDFNTSHDDLLDIAKYVQFYLNLIVTSDNVSLLYHLAMKGKTVRDSESHTFTENLYVICELAQELIKTRANSQSWSIQSYPGKVRLPSDILRPLPNAEAANKILKTIYLPEETLSWLSELSKNSKVKEKKERKPLGKRKAPVTKANGYSKRARGKRKRQTDDESDDVSSVADSSDVEMKSVKEDPASEENHDLDNDEAEEQLGRGARSRAKARNKRLMRTTTTKAGPGTPTSDG
ncbi:cohesin-associated protein Pds5 [Tricholoma matsutake]|nr:cohesin-associated protein Pds5 [Tricholoma matsutake 945]